MLGRRVRDDLLGLYFFLDPYAKVFSPEAHKFALLTLSREQLLNEVTILCVQHQVAVGALTNNTFEMACKALAEYQASRPILASKSQQLTSSIQERFTSKSLASMARTVLANPALRRPKTRSLDSVQAGPQLVEPSFLEIDSVNQDSLSVPVSGVVKKVNLRHLKTKNIISMPLAQAEQLLAMIPGTYEFVNARRTGVRKELFKFRETVDQWLADPGVPLPWTYVKRGLLNMAGQFKPSNLFEFWLVWTSLIVRAL